MDNRDRNKEWPRLEKAPTGILGFDEITGGGIPKGRPTLVCGGAGCGKTLFGAEFLVHGAVEFGEPGVLMSFEESVPDLFTNLASLGFDLEDLVARGLLVVDHVHLERGEIEENGDYDLEGLFVRLGYAIDRIGAKRVVLDTVEALFGGLSNPGILRAELRRLFGWLKSKGVTAVITGEKGERTFTRHGLEEYVSDCVVVLDHRVERQVSTRRLRVAKYRGSLHGTNEFPFLIDEGGISVLPMTAAGLESTASDERVSTGVPALDDMLEGKGLFKGSTVLLSGTSGSGKSSLAAHFARACCERGERCLYFAFEESSNQIVRNMRSIGVDLQPFLDAGLLIICATRASQWGIEMHLSSIFRLIHKYQPSALIVDPITSLLVAGDPLDVEFMFLRMVDMLKAGGVTTLLTSMTSGNESIVQGQVGLSSLMDTWLLVRDLEMNGERNRTLYVLKSRGMAHSNQIREFELTSSGIVLREAYLGPEGVLTGSARLAQEDRAREAAVREQTELIDRLAEADRRRRALAFQLEALRAELDAEERAIERIEVGVRERANRLRAAIDEMARARGVRQREDIEGEEGAG